MENRLSWLPSQAIQEAKSALHTLALLYHLYSMYANLEASFGCFKLSVRSFLRPGRYLDTSFLLVMPQSTVLDSICCRSFILSGCIKFSLIIPDASFYVITTKMCNEPC